MPHLSPLKWLFALILFSLTLIFSSSLMWWNFTPSFTMPKKNSSIISLKWPW